MPAGETGQNKERSAFVQEGRSFCCLAQPKTDKASMQRF